MGLAVIVAVGPAVMVMTVVIRHKMLLIGGGMVMTLVTVGGVHMGGAIGMGVDFGLLGRSTAGSAKHANYGKKKK